MPTTIPKDDEPHFLVLSIGPYAAAAKDLVEGWRDLVVVRRVGDFDSPFRVFTMPACGAVFLLVDAGEECHFVAREALGYLGSVGLRPMVGLARPQSAIKPADWEMAEELSAQTGACVVLPTDSDPQTLADFVRAWASARTGHGNYVAMRGEDIEAIATGPCVGSFGAWQPGAGAPLLFGEFGQSYGRKIQSAFVTVEGDLRSSLAEVNEAIETLEGDLPEEVDLFFCTSFDETEKPIRSLVTLLSRPAQRA